VTPYRISLLHTLELVARAYSGRRVVFSEAARGSACESLSHTWRDIKAKELHPAGTAMLSHELEHARRALFADDLSELCRWLRVVENKVNQELRWQEEGDFHGCVEHAIATAAAGEDRGPDP
jgi:hypothetical protein